MADTTMGQSYLMNYYLGRQSIIEYAYNLALMDAKADAAKRDILLARQQAIEDQIMEMETLALKLQTDKAKAQATGNASAIISGYIGIGNIKAKEAANRVRAQELAVDQVTAPSRVKTYILNSSADRIGGMDTKAGAEGFVGSGGTQFAEINQALADLTPEQRYDAVLNLADQVNAEMIGDGAPATDRQAVKNAIYSQYLPGVSNPSRSGYNTAAQAKQQQIQSQATTLPTAKLNQYLSTLTGGNASQAQVGVDALVESSLADDGKIGPEDAAFINAAKGITGIGKVLQDGGFASYDLEKGFKFRAKKSGETQEVYDQAKLAAKAQYDAEFDQAINNLFMSRQSTPEAQIAKRIGAQRVKLGIVEEQLQAVSPKGAGEFQQMFGERLQQVMSPEMFYDTKTREGRKAYKMYEMEQALQAQMAKMSPTDVANYKIALQSAEDYETMGYDNAERKYRSINEKGSQYADRVIAGLRNGTMDKNKVIPELQQYFEAEGLGANEVPAFRTSALGLIYLDQYRTSIPQGMTEKDIPRQFRTNRKQPEFAPAKGFQMESNRVPKGAIDKAFPETGDPSQTGF
jgi:hypothetical protein